MNEHTPFQSALAIEVLKSGDTSYRGIENPPLVRARVCPRARLCSAISDGVTREETDQTFGRTLRIPL
jgi:hypothetical protein